MDFSVFFSQLQPLWVLIPFFILAVIFKSAWFKGVLGEFIVNLATKLFLDKRRYQLIKNVTLPTPDGSTQIDHIIVSPFGVFVVETKNMKGWIFGNAKHKTWTQKIYRHSSKFQNPLHQNYKHVKSLQALLGLDDSQIHSVVVFVGDSEFKTPMPENITYCGGYIRYVKSKQTKVLTNQEVEEIKNKIREGRLAPSLNTNLAHIRHVKTIKQAKELIDDPICPKCNSAMIQRQARKGKNAGQVFWGCSNFPHCRTTKEIP